MNILLIDGGQHFGHSAGRLNHTLHQTARDTLTALGHAVKETVIEAGYDKDAEVEKWLWMDAVVWQMPGWWMGEPWTVKKYIDEVFTAGVGENKLVANDGRHRVNPTEGYGTGGLLHGKKHMRRLPAKVISLRARAWTACTCISTRPTSSSAPRACPRSSATM